MQDTFWNGLFHVRREGAQLGEEALRLVLRLRKRGYAERTCREPRYAIIHLGKVLHERGVTWTPDEAVVEEFILVITCQSVAVTAIRRGAKECLCGSASHTCL